MDAARKTSIGRVARQAGIADFFGNAQAAVDFHGAGVAALHFRELDCSFVALDQRAAHAALAEVERQRQADRPGADDQDIGFRQGICGDVLHCLAVRGRVRASYKPPVYRMLRLRAWRYASEHQAGDAVLDDGWHACNDAGGGEEGENENGRE